MTMTSKRPRKSPEHIRPASRKKNPPRPHPALAVFGAAGRGLLGAGAGTGRLVTRYPAMVLGGASFIVALSFISANALWYQHGHHPAPIFQTRDPDDPTAFMGSGASEAQPEVVTTFRIERGDDAAAEARAPDPAPTSAVPPKQTPPATSDDIAAMIATDPVSSVVPAERPSDVGSGQGIDPVAAAILKAEGQLPAQPAAVSADLVMKIQRGLTNLAYSDIKVDGVAGEQTRKAIRHFQKHYRLPQTGEPSQDVLKKMKSIGAL